MTDLTHLPAEVRDQLEEVIELSVTKAVAAGMRKHRLSGASLHAMTVDVNFVDVGNRGKPRTVESFSTMPAVPPLPEIGGIYVHRDEPHGTPTIYTVHAILHEYRYLSYGSDRLNEMVTEITIQVRKRI